MAADSESGADPPASSAAPDSVTVRPGAAGQRGEQLGDVQRVARRPVGQPQQAAVRPAAGQGRHQLGHRRLGQRGELDPDRVGGHPPQRQQVAALGHRAHHPDQQQRLMLRRLRQPPPQGDAGLVGPLQVIDDQDGRPDRALLGDQGQQLLRQHRGHVRAAVGADLAAQQPDDRGAPGIRRRLAHPQPVEERQQRQRLAQFVTGPPEHLAAGLRRLGQRLPAPERTCRCRARLRSAPSRPRAPAPRLLSAPSATPSRRRARLARQQGSPGAWSKLYYHCIYRTSAHFSDINSPNAHSGGLARGLPDRLDANFTEPCIASSR